MAVSRDPQWASCRLQGCTLDIFVGGVIAVIDYGMGNLHSVASALRHVGAGDVFITNDKDRSAQQIG